VGIPGLGGTVGSMSAIGGSDTGGQVTMCHDVSLMSHHAAVVLTLRSICWLSATRLGPRLWLGVRLKLVLGLAGYCLHCLHKGIRLFSSRGGAFLG
jgi:hypothetical protein